MITTYLSPLTASELPRTSKVRLMVPCERCREPCTRSPDRHVARACHNRVQPAISLGTVTFAPSPCLLISTTYRRPSILYLRITHLPYYKVHVTLTKRNRHCTIAEQMFTVCFRDEPWRSQLSIKSFLF